LIKNLPPTLFPLLSPSFAFSGTHLIKLLGLKAGSLVPVGHGVTERSGVDDSILVDGFARVCCKHCLKKLIPGEHKFEEEALAIL
jgi:hypothetical protein